ncbi:Mgl repressor and galactose ultrainduction factor [Limihaloglobus sulfuriphilus]|uniref:Mgl repressor and galactose ultrainduction factor n=1 Tax=Limihaloglobus sulfuriphilus TaxID=1851148 RepID=A0A1Q2MCW9_9BACT|nr:LacI family DNA-binding transcriptional regulator [Limihaloglobus sulfuriphilus]AQQ70541.1 Mgl repressor and galactose ultrainduction factor [Limihaloglobus sulfuriphilus]
MSKEKRPTIVDIANSLQISPASVSRALRNAGKVGVDLRKKILIEAKRINYQPNFAAKALRNQSSQLIGLIIPNFFSFQIDELVRKIQYYVQKKHYGIILGVTEWETENEIEQLEFMAEKRVEGIIVKSKGMHQTIDKIQELSMDGMRVVSLLDKVDIPNVSSVLVNNAMGGYLATKHLLEKGHRRILYVTYQQTQSNEGNDSHFSRERYFGMLRAYAEMNIKRPDNLVFYDKSTNQNHDTEAHFKEYISRHTDFTAIFAYDDQIAAGVSRAIRSHGYSIPEDFSLVGFDDSIFVNKWSNPPITVIKQPDDEIACEAVRLLVNDNNNELPPAHSVVINPELIKRESVASIVVKQP